MIRVPNHKVPISIIFETVLFLEQENANKKNLELYINASKSYANSSLQTLKMLECFCDANYTLKDSIKGLLKKYNNKNQSKDFLKELLMLWNPFILFLTYLYKGYSQSESINKLAALFEIDNKNELLTFFEKWIKELEIKIEIDESQDGLEEKILAKKYSNEIYICDSLNDEIYKFIDDDIKTSLRNSLEKIGVEPRDSICNAGQAFEDFLRLIGEMKGIDTVKKMSGIAQIGNELKSKNILHSKHNNVCVSISDIRNMSGHSKEKETLQAWKLTSKAATTYLHYVLTSMQSIYYNVVHDLLIY